MCFYEGLPVFKSLLHLLSLDDYPAGTWLGDENNPEMRVRCPVSPADMLHITTNCRTAEKMALTLLDYLFHREVQAMSNLSGQGKHGKKQLDPLMIYGIRCEFLETYIIIYQLVCVSFTYCHLTTDYSSGLKHIIQCGV